MRKVAIIGGGAAGFFAAINIKEKCPNMEVIVLEKTSKLLQKVKASGGGRCNVTNGRSIPGELTKFYPRGGRKLHKLFEEFGTKEMRAWLKIHGVKTRIEDDQRVFPHSNNSQTIIDCFVGTAKKLGVKVVLNSQIQSIAKEGDHWMVTTVNELYQIDAVVFATGSSPRSTNLLENLNIELNSPVPSLFTFHISDERIEGLAGIPFLDATLKVATTKLIETGPLLITHWGISGPAVLKLSAWGARELAAQGYKFTLLINYLSISYDNCRSQLQKLSQTSPNRKLKNHPFLLLPKRFWLQLLDLLNLDEKTYGDLGKQGLNKLSEELTQAHFSVTGKSAFKEEFVTCGGIDLSEVDLTTFESCKHKGLFFSGEALDIDALTGGFNFQACWSAGWVISESIKNRTVFESK